MNSNSTVSTSTPLSFAAPGATHVAGVVECAVDLLATWHQRAADRRQLLTLDDGMLRDIGLSRADVELESGKPFWRG